MEVLGSFADRYFGSFPKVGIVIPNMADWILPDLRDILGPTLGLTLELPQPGQGGLPIGSRVSPTSDGFLIWMNPCTAPVGWNQRHLACAKVH